MFRTLVPRILTLGFLLFMGRSVQAQQCVPPNIIPNPKIYNIFSSDQEMVLGDLTYQRLAGEMHFVRDPELVAYIARIGAKLEW